MLRGSNRFEGYGNVKVATNHGNRAGWQLICYECQKLSDVIHRAGSSYPPKVLVQLFSEKGWKVGNNSANDVCPVCLEKRRQRAREERKQYAKGNVDRLLDMIRQVDLMLASNVSIDYGPYQPQITAQLKSLCETAYLCGMLPVEPFRATPPDVSKLDTPPAPPSIEEKWAAACEEVPVPPPPEEPPPPAPKPSPPPPPAPEGTRIAPRTAAFLADIRKQIFKGVAA